MKSLADKLKSQCKSLKLDVSQKKAAAPGASSELAEAACQTDAVEVMSSEEAAMVPPLDVAPEAESPDTEDEEKRDLDQYLDEFLETSLNVAADDNINKVQGVSRQSAKAKLKNRHFTGGCRGSKPFFLTLQTGLKFPVDERNIKDVYYSQFQQQENSAKLQILHF